MTGDTEDMDIEELMRPGRLSTLGFLGPTEKLYEVLREDDETVRRLGLTHEAIADRIEYFIKAVGYPSLEGVIIDGIYRVGGKVWRGGQECPWKDVSYMPYSNMDLFVINTETGERLDFPGGIVHLIRKHHFYEGKESPYRVDPEKAARVLNLIKI
jgi:hypothetical protein